MHCLYHTHLQYSCNWKDEYMYIRIWYVIASKASLPVVQIIDTIPYKLYTNGACYLYPDSCNPFGHPASLIV